MTKKKLRLFALAGLGMLPGMAAWAQPPPKSEASSGKEGVAAYMGNETITTQELDAVVLKTNMKLAQSLYDARRSALDQVILERALGKEASEKGVKVEQLIRDKVAEQVKPVTDAEVEAYYKTNSARMGNRPLEQVSPQIRSQLTSQREKEGRDNLLTSIKEKAGVKVALEPPRANVVVAANDPIQGPANAKVTIVEFSDFQ